MPRDPTKPKKSKKSKIEENAADLDLTPAAIEPEIVPLEDEEEQKTPSQNEAQDEDEEEAPVLSRKEQRKAKKRSEAGLDPVPLADKKVVDTAALAQAPQAAKTSQFGVWIGNLNFTTSSNAIKSWLANQLLSVQGDIVRVNLPSGQNGKSKGFAYVDFSTEEAQQAAIKASEGHLDGRKLLIKSSSDYSGRPQNKGETSVAGDIAAILHDATAQPSSSKDAQATATQTLSKKMKKIASVQKNEPGPTLFLGNLGFETTERDIRALFDAHHRATLKWQPNAKKSLKKRVSKKAKSKAKSQRAQTDGSQSGDAEASSDDEEEDSDESDSGEDSDSESEAEPDLPDAGIRQVRLGTFEDTGKCKGWAFVDFFDIKKATTSLLNPHNHFLNGRSLKVEFASAEAVRRGGNKQQKLLKSYPSNLKKGAATTNNTKGRKRSFEQAAVAEPAPKPLEEIQLLTKEELEGPAPKKHKPTQEERKAAREERKNAQASGRTAAPARHRQAATAANATAIASGKGQRVVFDE